MNYNDNGVKFKDIGNAGLKTGGNKISSGEYVVDSSGNITRVRPIINAIDIDWNKATIGEGNDAITITSTGQLLALIAQLKQALGNIDTASNQSILDRLTLIESTVRELQEGGGGTIPENLVEQLNTITSNINSLQNDNRDIQTRLTTLEQNGGGGGNNQAIINQLAELTNKVNALDGIKHQIMEKTTYDSLTSYDPNTLYFIIGEPDYIIVDGGGSGGGGTTPSTRIDLDAISTQLTVNGQLHRESNIVLEPGGTYVVSGTLAGTLTIDASQYTSAQMDIIGNTEIILTDVIIVSDNETYGILYKTPAENKGFKDLIITVNKNTANIVCCRYEQPKAENQWGAIHSMNNLVLRGTGYLSVRNDGGHGIRATEIDVAGPHIYATTIHDAVHAKKLFWNYGTLYTATANDVLGTGDDGRIIVFGGTFNTITLQENGTLFDSGITGLYSDNVVMTGISRMKNMVVLSPENYASAMQKAYPGVVYKYADKAAYTAGNGEQVLLTNNIYKITAGTNVFVSVVGVINKPIEIVTTGEKDATIYLNNAYIEVNENYPTIYFNPTDKKGKIKIFNVQDSINIIKNTYSETTFVNAETYQGDAIKSENNINIEIKNGAHMFVLSKFADGIDGGTMKITDSKGSLVVTNCGQRGLKGNVIVIGPDVEVDSSHITSYHQDPDEQVGGESVYVTFDGNCVVKDNCTQVEPGAAEGQNKNTGFADIYARNGKATKGEFAVKNSELNGIVVTGTIGAVVSIDMDNASNMNFNRIVTPSVIQTKIVTASNETTVAYNIYKEPIA